MLNDKNRKIENTEIEKLKVEKQKLEALYQKVKAEKLNLQKKNKELVLKNSILEDLNNKLKLEIKNGQDISNHKIEIRSKGKINFVDFNDLMYIHAEENGCRYFLNNNISIWNDERLSRWEEKLDTKYFVRIHRSTMVQKKYIAKRSYNKISLTNETELKVGRKYKENL